MRNSLYAKVVEMFNENRRKKEKKNIEWGLIAVRYKLDAKVAKMTKESDEM